MQRMFGHISFILIAKIEPYIIDTSCNCANLETSTVFIGGLGQNILNIKNCCIFHEICSFLYIKIGISLGTKPFPWQPKLLQESV